MKKLLRIEQVLIILAGFYFFFVFPLMPHFGFIQNLYWLILICMQAFFIFLPGYLVHYFLRAMGRRNRVIAFAHVILSAVLFFLMMSMGDFATSVIPGLHTVIYPVFSLASDFELSNFNYFLLAFVILQLLFVIYGLSRGRRK